MLHAWILYPLVLCLLCGGLGLLVDRITGARLPGTLVLPAGFAAAIVVGGFTTASDTTAELTTPLLVALAVAGAGLSLPWRFGRPDPWPTAIAFAVFCVFAAPVVLSGEPTFTGYIKLDDTATWLAMTDRIMEHGRSLSGLEPSSYRATLDFNLAGGYPIGVFVPFGAAQKLTGGDLAWVFQPYMSFIAALLSLSLWEILRGVLAAPRARALAVFVAAQPALLYGYALWGGIKEIAAAALVALAAALAPAAIRQGARPRDVFGLALVAAALVGVLSPGGALWLGPLLAALAIVAFRSRGPRATLVQAGAFILLFLVLVAPVLSSGLVPPTSKPLVGSDGEGNLRGPLNVLQALGIWPNGDFRFDPDVLVLSVILIGLGLFAALLGLWHLVRRRSLAPLLFASALLTAAVIAVAGSPWAAAKALATVSPVALSLAVVGAIVARRIDRIAGALLVVAVAGGVLWSNALAYHDAWLAPYDQLRELEAIGEEFAGEGPTLMTEYQPYGVRHFLRAADAEGASELRARPVPLVAGGEAEKGEWVDTDEIAFASLLTYRTLVLRRSPAQSRPPAVYSRVLSGAYYEVWQRPVEPAAEVVQHLGLGDFYQPAAPLECGQVSALALTAGPEGRVAAAVRRPNLVASLSAGRYPADWVPTEPGSPDLTPRGPGTVRLALDIESPGAYDLFVQGSVRNPLRLTIDGTEVGSSGYQLNASRQFLDLGRVRIGTGRHLVELTLEGQSLAPGSGGPPEPIGPLVLSPASAEDPPLIELPASRARELCGRNLDWVEALR